MSLRNSRVNAARLSLMLFVNVCSAAAAALNSNVVFCDSSLAWLGCRRVFLAELRIKFDQFWFKHFEVNRGLQNIQFTASVGHALQDITLWLHVVGDRDQARGIAAPKAANHFSEIEVR